MSTKLPPWAKGVTEIHPNGEGVMMKFSYWNQPLKFNCKSGAWWESFDERLIHRPEGERRRLTLPHHQGLRLRVLIMMILMNIRKESCGLCFYFCFFSLLFLLGTKGWPKSPPNHRWGGFCHHLGSMGVGEPPLGAQGPPWFFSFFFWKNIFLNFFLKNKKFN